MERRAFVTSLAAAAALCGQASGAEQPAPPAQEKRYAALAEAATRASGPAKAGLRYCFDRLAAKEAGYADCARAASDLVAGAQTLAALAAMGAPLTAGFAKTAADIAAACKKECDKFPEAAACKACGEACAALLDACGKAAL